MAEDISKNTEKEADAAIQQATLMAASIYDHDERAGAPLFVMIECTKALCAELAALRVSLYHLEGH